MIQSQNSNWLCTSVLLFTTLLFIGCSSPKTTFTVSKAAVIKVYSATDPSGHRFVCYVVDRGGVEIVVSDTLAGTTYKVGDVIEYLDQKIEISGTKTLSFSISG